MKKFLTILFAAVILLNTFGCSGKEYPFTNPSKAKDKTEIVVFAAASLQETMEEIKSCYEKEHPEILLTMTFDSSGTLKKQIEEGAVCDLFISASPKQINALDVKSSIEQNPNRLDVIDSESRIDLLENKVCLAVMEENPAGVTSYNDLMQRLKDGKIFMAMGNADVPVGQYTQKILTYYDLDEVSLAQSGVLTYGSNVKEVTTQVKEGSVDCGIIYATDAYAAGLIILDTATKDMCGQVIYPAAILKSTEHREQVQMFLNYLTGVEASEVFEMAGFTALAPNH